MARSCTATTTVTAPDGSATVVDTIDVALRQMDGRWLCAIEEPFFARLPM